MYCPTFALSSVLSPWYARKPPLDIMPADLMIENVQASCSPGSGMMTSGAVGADSQQPILSVHLGACAVPSL